MKKLGNFGQGLILFLLIGLPITFAQAKKYWYLVVVWIAILLILNYFLWDSLIEFSKYLQELQAYDRY